MKKTPDRHNQLLTDGVKFSGSGNFRDTRPLTPSIMKKNLVIISILLLAAGCIKNPPIQKDAARGTLSYNEYGSCSPANAHGTFINGIATNKDSNWVDLDIYVTKVGTYNISTAKVNGVSFAGSGSFGDTGVSVVRLYASGTYATAGDITYPVTFDSSHCQFDILVQDSLGLTLPDNSWTFTANGHTYSGPFQMGVYQIPQSDASVFESTGFTWTGNRDSVLYLDASKSDYGSILQGTYPTTTYGNDFAFAHTGPGQTAPVNYLFSANSGTPGVLINITFLSNVQKPGGGFSFTTIGSFNGTALDSAGHVVNITNAYFKAVD